MDKNFLKSLLATALAVCLSSGNCAATTLQQVFLDAVESDPDIKAEHAQFLAEVDNSDKAFGRMLPSVILSGEIARNRQDVTIGAGASGNSGQTYFDSNQLELAVKQPLYRKDIFSEVDSKQADALVAENEYRFAYQDFIARVVNQYLAVLAASNDVYFLRSERDAIDKQLQNAQHRFKAGASTNADLYEAQASYDLAVAQLIVAETTLFDTHAALEEITDKQYDELADLDENFVPVFDGPNDLQQWILTAEQHSPKLKASKNRVTALRYQVEKSSAGHYPQLDVVARYSKELTGGRFGESKIDDRSISLQLKLPIYEGGTVSAGVRESNNRLMAEKEKLTKTRRLIRREISKAFKSVNSSINHVKALKLAVKSANSALDAIKSGYKAGSRTNADILDAQRELFRAKRDYMKIQYQFISSYFQLKLLAGKLVDEDIKTVSQWFQ